MSYPKLAILVARSDRLASPSGGKCTVQRMHECGEWPLGMVFAAVPNRAI